MNKIDTSILISSHNRLPLFRRTLHSIANNPPSGIWELVVADDGSTDDILGELSKYQFRWKFIKIDKAKMERLSGLKHFFNNASYTNNVAFAYSMGHNIFLMGNEIIAYDEVFNNLIKELPPDDDAIVFSTTYDVPQRVLDNLDELGSDVTPQIVNYCSQWPLASQDYHSDVTNYISLVKDTTWEKVCGYDVQFIAGIACEDSDFVRRIRTLPNFKTVRSRAVSLHQYHGGVTRYDANIKTIPQERWDEGLRINRGFYNSWNGQTLPHLSVNPRICTVQVVDSRGRGYENINSGRDWLYRESPQS